MSSFRSGFIALVGRTNVGKSTLTNALAGSKLAIVSDKPQTTRNRILAVVNRASGQIVLYDTPGIHKPQHAMNRRMLAAAIAGLEHADLACWVVDLTQPPGAGDRYVREALKRSGRPVLLGVNKIDALPKPRILAAIDGYRGMLDFVEVVPVSAKTGDNVELLAERLIAHLPESERLFPEDTLTDRPERFFVAELIREQLLKKTREELPHAAGIVIESFKEEERLVRIQAAIVVEREGQKAIVIGKGGSMLKAIGTAARHEIESFLGAKVFLGLFVKVRAHWRDDARALDELGLDTPEG